MGRISTFVVSLHSSSPTVFRDFRFSSGFCLFSSSSFFLFPTTVPSFPIVCAFIRATYRPPVQFLAIHFSIEEEKKKHNMMTECGYGLLPPLFWIFFFYIPPEMKWSISDDDNLKTVEGGESVGRIQWGLTSCCCFSPPSGWMCDGSV